VHNYAALSCPSELSAPHIPPRNSSPLKYRHCKQVLYLFIYNKKGAGIQCYCCSIQNIHRGLLHIYKICHIHSINIHSHFVRPSHELNLKGKTQKLKIKTQPCLSFSLVTACSASYNTRAPEWN